ncbi:unnamed protein product [Cochlearia groenlandica]
MLVLKRASSSSRNKIKRERDRKVQRNRVTERSQRNSQVQERLRRSCIAVKWIGFIVVCVLVDWGLDLGSNARGVLFSPQLRLVPERWTPVAGSVSVCADTGSSCTNK